MSKNPENPQNDSSSEVLKVLRTTGRALLVAALLATAACGKDAPSEESLFTHYIGAGVIRVDPATCSAQMEEGWVGLDQPEVLEAVREMLQADSAEIIPQAQAQEVVDSMKADCGK